MRKALVLVAVTALSVALATDALHSPPDHDDTAYWVWRWSDLELVDSADKLLLYQGDFHSTGQPVSLVKRGVDPFAIPGRSEIGILIRLHDIDDAEAFADQAIYLVRHWQSHQVDVTEIQLDYDCPSERLPDYRLFVDRTQSLLDRQDVNIPLSITGLLTWHSDDSQGLERLAESVTYIAFQLYDRHDPVANLDAFLASFKHYKHPYKIGISTSAKFDGMEYPQNANYQGNLVFLNVAQ